MTVGELSRYFVLQERLNRDEQMIESLRSAACPGAQALTGMPGSPNVKDRVGDLAVEIADLEAQLVPLRKQISEAKANASAYIEAIEDEYIRTIFRLRFIRCLSWPEIADIIGGANTPEGTRKTCYRYLKTESCPGASARIP